jgi:hypothetical protein
MVKATFQSVPAIIAEEFEVSLDKVIIKQTNERKKIWSSAKSRRRVPP